MTFTYKVNSASNYDNIILTFRYPSGVSRHTHVCPGVHIEMEIARIEDAIKGCDSNFEVIFLKF